jgi:hypothetical protein
MQGACETAFKIFRVNEPLLTRFSNEICDKKAYLKWTWKCTEVDSKNVLYKLKVLKGKMWGRGGWGLTVKLLLP